MKRSDENIDQEMYNIKEIYNLPDFFKKELLINLALLCANKIIASLINNLFETFSKFLESGANLNFVIDYGEVYNGLVGSEQKVDEVLISKRLSHFSHLCEKLNYGLPSIVVSNEVYENFSKTIKENFYVSDIVLTEFKKNGSSKREIIHRQYLDFSQIKYYEDNSLEKLKKKDLDVFIKRNKINEETISFYGNVKENKDNFSDFVIKDTEVKINTNFINNNILNAINRIYLDILNKEYKIAHQKIKRVLKNITNYNDVFEFNISQNLKSLEKHLQDYISKNKILFYTIIHSYSEIQ